MNYYFICFVLSALLTAIHIFKWKNQYGLHFSMMYIFATVANFGYWQIDDATQLSQAILANKLAYVGGCFSTLSLLMCIFDVCKVHVPKLIKVLLYAITGFIYGTNLTVGYNDMFYKNVSFELIDGKYTLVKDYAFFHTLFYVMLVSYVLVSIVILIIGFRKRKEISLKSVSIMFIVMLINFLSFFIGRKLIDVELIVASYVITELLVSVITNRIALYNLDEMVIASTLSKGETGAASFDFAYNFLGSNQTARKCYPNLELLAVDKKIDVDNDSLKELVMWLDELKKNGVFETIYRKEDKYIKVTGQYLIDREKKRGYNFIFADYTEEQQRGEERIRIATKAKSEVLARMSHEIRTPINAIMGMNEMILRTTGELNSKQYAEDVKRATSSLLEIVNEILDFSKIESGKMELVCTEYNLANLYKDVVNMFSIRANEKGLEFWPTIDENLPTGLYGDDVKIRQVLANLLSNAVKYTKKGSVEFTIKGKEVEDKLILCFSIKDTGIGIRPEDMTKLFAEFERIEEEANRGVEGTGLGMSITIRLLQMMGTNLQVESVYGEGSEFYFELEQNIVDVEPIRETMKKQQEQLTQEVYHRSFAAPKATILVVDDNPMNRRVFTSILQELKMQIDQADSGQECLELVAKKHYDIIFLDHMMPTMDGVETLHRLKDMMDSKCQETPIIALTANVVNGAKEFYLEEGFDGFMGKPFNPDELEKLIANLLPQEYIEYDIENELLDNIPEHNDFPKIEGLDWDVAYSHFNNKGLLLASMEDVYKAMPYENDKLKRFYCVLKEAEEKEEELVKAYRIQVHSMKSTANLIGFVKLGEWAKELERAAGECDFEIVCSQSEAFLEQWLKCQNSMAPLFKHEEEKKTMNQEVVLTKLQELKSAFEEMDLDIMDELIKDINEFEIPQVMKEEIEVLDRYVRDLDVEQGVTLIERVLSNIN